MSAPGITIDLFPAREGDCVLVTCAGEGETRRILVDGGRAATWKDLRPVLAALEDDERELDLLVVTHVDRDHIEGVLSMLHDAERPVTFRDVWFNGFHHLIEQEAFGAKQGEKLTSFLVDNEWPWNAAFDDEAVVLGPDGPVSRTIGGAKLTVLSPDRKKLADLHPKWLAECEKAGLIPHVPAMEPEESDEEAFGPIDVEALCGERFEEDDAEANGSSIALLLEYAGCSVLLTGDAHVDRLRTSLELLGAAPDRPLAVDVVKLSHHGSAHNVSRELLELLDCREFLISSNGSYFQHPSRAAIARVVRYARAPKTLRFNYATEFTLPWDQAALRTKHGYTPIYGTNGRLRLELPKKP